MSRDGDNRRIAEWLEPFKQATSIPFATDSYTASKLGAWHTVRYGFEDWRWEPRNFFTDEAANAMVLDALLVRHWKITERPHDFQWAWNEVARLIMKEIVWHQNNDRKTAICLAALRLIEEGR